MTLRGCRESRKKCGSFTVSHVTLYYFCTFGGADHPTQETAHTDVAALNSDDILLEVAFSSCEHSFTHLAYLHILVHKTALGSSSLMVGRSEQITIFLVNQ